MNDNNKSLLVIPAQVTIVGDLSTPGKVYLGGKFHGTLDAGSVVIGRSAELIGKILGEDVAVAGHVEANIYAKSLWFKNGCHVTGEVYHTHLKVEDGALFEGKSRRCQDPRGLAGSEDSLRVDVKSD